jgi:selenide, water dikinase
VEPGTAVMTDGQRIAASAVVWATGAGAPPWLRNTGLTLDAAGFIAVNAHLQSGTHAEVFAAGDCAAMQDARHPKSGVYAVRQGPLLAANLQRALAGKTLLTYRPQRRALALISTGDRYAVASYGSLALAGKWVWLWKDHVDRGFMARYQSLEPHRSTS